MGIGEARGDGAAGEGGRVTADHAGAACDAGVGAGGVASRYLLYRVLLNAKGSPVHR